MLKCKSFFSAPPRASRGTHLMAICYSRIIQNFQVFSTLWYFLEIFLFIHENKWETSKCLLTWHRCLNERKYHYTNLIRVSWPLSCHIHWWDYGVMSNETRPGIVIRTRGLESHASHGQGTKQRLTQKRGQTVISVKQFQFC